VNAIVKAVSVSARHTFSKPNVLSIRLVQGLGIEGDAHMGATVKHRSRVAKAPQDPNLRQVHLIHEELFADVGSQGFKVAPGEMGENITTSGIDLLSLPQGARLHIGEAAIVEVTGLRNPCGQIDKFQQGLMKAVLGRDEIGGILRKTGVMSIVIAGGDVRPGDAIRVEMPAGELRKLDVV
jgi:MOSC domain-containing protein YiiM